MVIFDVFNDENEWLEKEGIYVEYCFSLNLGKSETKKLEKLCEELYLVPFIYEPIYLFVSSNVYRLKFTFRVFLKPAVKTKEARSKIIYFLDFAINSISEYCKENGVEIINFKWNELDNGG